LFFLNRSTAANGGSCTAGFGGNCAILRRRNLCLLGFHLFPQRQRSHLRHKHQLPIPGRWIRWKQLHDWKHRCGQDLVDRQFGRQHGAEPDSHFFRTAPNTPPMMPHPSTGVVHLSSAMRPAESTVIVRNFNKGLMQVRSPIGPLAPSVVIRKQIRTPKLELLPARVTPRKGLFLSTLLHTATAATLAALPILFPSWLGRVPSTPRDLDREFEVVYQPLQLPA